MSENILEINNLSKYFGGLAAVSDCSIKVKRGTITGIIGPCLLYTSDAADEEDSVDLGGRRIIKKRSSTYLSS